MATQQFLLSFWERELVLLQLTLEPNSLCCETVVWFFIMALIWYRMEEEIKIRKKITATDQQ